MKPIDGHPGLRGETGPPGLPGQSGRPGERGECGREDLLSGEAGRE